MITKKLESFFDFNEILASKDNFTNYKCSFTANLNIEKLNSLDENQYTILTNHLSEYGYDWTMQIKELNYTISQASFEKADLEGLETGELINVDFSVFKKGNRVVVFDEEKFFEFVNSESLHSILLYFKDKTDGVVFYNSKNSAEKSNGYLGFNKEIKQKKRTHFQISPQCNFNNYSDFKFVPEDFHLLENPANDTLLQLLKKLHLVFLIVYIFDNTEIDGNTFKTKLSGYKTYKHELNFAKMEVSSLDVYCKIYDWIYSEANKVEDKIGIARNILSIYIEQGSLYIDMDVFSSILSANNTYIKGNISKYVEVRNKVHGQLEQLSDRVNKTLDAFYSNFQKSIFVFISFYLSIFVIRTYAKIDVTVIFSKQLTYMAIALLGLSFVFMLFSNWILNLEKKRIESKYEDVKERAKDILVQQDIDKLLKEDKEFKSEKKFLNRRRWLYIVLWLITIATFLTVLIYTSDYI